MGADFVYAICKIPTNTEGEFVDFGEALDRAIVKRFRNVALNKDLLLETVEDCGIYVTESQEEDYESLVSDLATNVAAFVSTAWQSRDISSIKIDGKYYWITGGMSWGDSPTDSYDIVNLIDSLGITKETFTAKELN